MIKGIIDRFEGDYAVIEMDGETKDVHRSLLPNDAKVSDVVVMDGHRISIDQEETQRRKVRMKALMDEVWED